MIKIHKPAIRMIKVWETEVKWFTPQTLKSNTLEFPTQRLGT